MKAMVNAENANMEQETWISNQWLLNIAGRVCEGVKNSSDSTSPSTTSGEMKAPMEMSRENFSMLM